MSSFFAHEINSQLDVLTDIARTPSGREELFAAPNLYDDSRFLAYLSEELSKRFTDDGDIRVFEINKTIPGEPRVITSDGWQINFIQVYANSHVGDFEVMFDCWNPEDVIVAVDSDETH